jgi:PPOX class probable F420-dependent enzyme
MAELSDEARALFEEPNFAFLATVMPDGWPQVSPVWVDLDGGRIRVNTVLGRRKEQNMRRDPRVGIAVLDRDSPYRRVEVRGRVVEWTEGEEAERHIDALSVKYRGEHPYRRLDPDERRVIAHIEPERVSQRL